MYSKRISRKRISDSIQRRRGRAFRPFGWLGSPASYRFLLISSSGSAAPPKAGRSKSTSLTTWLRTYTTTETSTAVRTYHSTLIFGEASCELDPIHDSKHDQSIDWGAKANASGASNLGDGNEFGWHESGCSSAKMHRRALLK